MEEKNIKLCNDVVETMDKLINQNQENIYDVLEIFIKEFARDKKRKFPIEKPKLDRDLLECNIQFCLFILVQLERIKGNKEISMQNLTPIKEMIFSKQNKLLDYLKDYKFNKYGKEIFEGLGFKMDILDNEKVLLSSIEEDKQNIIN